MSSAGEYPYNRNIYSNNVSLPSRLNILCLAYSVRVSLQSSSFSWFKVKSGLCVSEAVACPEASCARWIDIVLCMSFLPVVTTVR